MVEKEFHTTKRTNPPNPTAIPVSDFAINPPKQNHHQLLVLVLLIILHANAPTSPP
jgi:hypothetical protein